MSKTNQEIVEDRAKALAAESKASTTSSRSKKKKKKKKNPFPTHLLSSQTFINFVKKYNTRTEDPAGSGNYVFSTTGTQADFIHDIKEHYRVHNYEETAPTFEECQKHLNSLKASFRAKNKFKKQLALNLPPEVNWDDLSSWVIDTKPKPKK